MLLVPGSRFLCEFYSLPSGQIHAVPTPGDVMIVAARQRKLR